MLPRSWSSGEEEQKELRKDLSELNFLWRDFLKWPKRAVIGRKSTASKGNRRCWGINSSKQSGQGWGESTTMRRSEGDGPLVEKTSALCWMPAVGRKEWADSPSTQMRRERLSGQPKSWAMFYFHFSDFSNSVKENSSLHYAVKV